MSIDLITIALNNNSSLRIAVDAWKGDQIERGEKVALYRAYADGDHSGASLTPEMRKNLRVSETVESSSPFAVNHMDKVIQTEADRLAVRRIEDTGKAANDWLKQLLAANRFDGLQMGVHEAALRDADTFIFVDYDEQKQRVRFSHEPAYDGVTGMLVLYEKRNQSAITAAVKVWHITSAGGDIADTLRVNVYYEDRIEKFISNGTGGLTAFQDGSTDDKGVAPWKNPKTGEPLGVPVIHFKNRAQSHDNYGRSEIDDAIPQQDALNRLMYSMVMTAELTGFQIRKAIGFDPPAGLTPGMWLVIGADGLTKDQVADAGVLEAGEIKPFLEGMNWIIEQIDDTTRTPSPASMGSSSSSGEALKQREVALVGKAKRAQVSFGNAWEDVCVMAHKVDSAFGTEAVPEYEEFQTQWRSAEIRNVAEETKNILDMRAVIGEEMTVRMLANVHDWTEEQIQQILSLKQKETETKALAMGALLPGFSGLTPPNLRNGNGNNPTANRALPAGAPPIQNQRPMEAMTNG